MDTLLVVNGTPNRPTHDPVPRTAAVSNARYWYNRTGRPSAEGSLTAEWETLADGLA